MGDFPRFRVLGFGVIFCRSVIRPFLVLGSPSRCKYKLAYRCKFWKITLAFDWLFRSQFGSCVTLDRRNLKHQMTAKNKQVLRQNQRSDKWDVYANTEGNVSFLNILNARIAPTRTGHLFTCAVYPSLIQKLSEIEKNNNFSISKYIKNWENRGRKIQLVVSCP